MIRLVLLLLILLWHQITFAADQTYNCTGTADQTGINTLIAGMTGDNTETLTISGNCVLTASVNITKGITVTGTGNRATTITAPDGDESFYIQAVNMAGTDIIRLTNLTITGGYTGGYDIRIESHYAWARLIIDNITFNNTASGYNIIVMPAESPSTAPTHQKILIHSCTRNSTSVNQEFIKAFGHGSTAWAADDGWGTDNYIFVENCIINAGTLWAASDTEGGARITWRYNDMDSVWLAQHDFGSTQRQRGTRSWETYNNIFACTGANCNSDSVPVQNFLRGGTGVFHHNAATGFTMLSNHQHFRGTQAGYIGVSCPDSGATSVCSDFVTHCVGGTRDKYACYQAEDCPGGTCPDANGGLTSYDCTADADCVDYYGTALKCVRIDGTGDGNYPCRDQMGRGKDNATTGVQAASPAFAWSNTIDGEAATINPSGTYIVANRDFYNRALQEGDTNYPYAPYTCPHPWAGLSGSCSPTTAGRAGYNNITGNANFGSGATHSFSGGSTITWQ